MTKAPQNQHDPTEHQKPCMTIDYARYEKMLDQSDLTFEQKKEFIDTLWNIIVEFITLGIEVLPLDEEQENNKNKEDKNDKKIENSPTNMLYSDQSKSEKHF